MKKVLFCIFFIFIFASSSNAAALYTTTIKECTSEEVADTLVEILTGKNFTVDEITPYKVTFNKGFGDGFWIASRYQTVIFNLIPRDGNVKMMVSQTELVQGIMKRQRSIEHLIPIIKEVRTAVDGTLPDFIENEAVDQQPGSGNQREMKLGITITDKGTDGFYRIKSVDPGSTAAKAQLAINDAIIEINGRTMSEYDKKAFEAYITNKWGAGSSLMMLIDRDGDQKMITLKKD